MSQDHIYHMERPPIQETILGVQFNHLPKFKNAHLGAFWKTLGAEWLNVVDAPVLPPQVERFGAHESSFYEAGFQLQLGGTPPVRMQIRKDSGDRMVQVQNGRFLFNWVKSASGQYPHYELNREAFTAFWRAFEKFVVTEGLGTPTVNQWEVTYIDRIAQGPLWNTPADWPKVLPGLAVPARPTANASLESFSGEWHYEIPDKRGRLHVRISHGLADRKPVLAVNSTARGPLANAGLASLLAGLDLGHEVIVTVFRELVSKSALEFWGYRECRP